MADYNVTIQIVLDVEAASEHKAKEAAEEQLSDFLRHGSFTDLMKVKRLSRIHPAAQ